MFAHPNVGMFYFVTKCNQNVVFIGNNVHCSLQPDIKLKTTTSSRKHLTIPITTIRLLSSIMIICNEDNQR